PYWYAVTSGVPAAITVLDSIDSARRGSLARDAVLFRITDSAGLPLTDLNPQVTPISGGGTVQTIVSHNSEVPGVFGINVRVIANAGAILIERMEAWKPVKSSASGTAARDLHMRKYIFATADGQAPDLRFIAETLECPGSAGAQEFTC